MLDFSFGVSYYVSSHPFSFGGVMENLVLYCLIGAGATHVLTQGFVFEGLRKYFYEKYPNSLGYLFYCPMCTGFWVGAIMAFLPLHLLDLDPISSGFMISITSALTSGLSDMMSKISSKED